MKSFSITDHDNPQGSFEGSRLLTNSNSDLIFIQGAEIEVNTRGISKGNRTEILIYGQDLNNKTLIRKLERIRRSRKEKMIRMVSKVNDLGFKVTVEDVILHLKRGEASIGRPHLAKALVKKGYVSTIDEAFDKYLKQGRPAYVAGETYPLDELINEARKMSAVTVLAHPLEITTDLDLLEKMIRQFADKGVDGVEVYHDYVRYRHDKTEELIKTTKNRLHGLCQELDLLETGGSDYHGYEKVETFEPVELPDETFLALLERIGILY